MYIFYGKLNWSNHAKAESFVLLFPGDLGYSEPVCAYWQWTVVANGKEKVQTWHETTIKSITKEDGGGLRVGFDFVKSNFFDVTINETATVALYTIRGGQGVKTDVQRLERVYYSDIKTPRCRVYMGKLSNYYAEDETVTLILPDGLEVGKHVGVFFQWTLSDAGVRNCNHRIVGPIRTVTQPDAEGVQSFTFLSEDEKHTWAVTVDDRVDTLVAVMHETKNYPQGKGDGPFVLSRTGWSAPGHRKALLARFGVGTDDRGIHEVRDLLTETLGWNRSDVEMLYFTSEPPEAAATLVEGQQAPTAARFQQKFSDLIRSAKPGDVRFVYVDVNVRQDPEPGEVDRPDGGWVLAAGEDGRTKEDIWNGWIAKELQSLAPSVNFTILSPSFIGGAILDSRWKARGIALSGIHESQKSFKHIERFWLQRPVDLYQDAKKFIRDHRDAGSYSSDRYLGPSPDERVPLPLDIDTGASHQDPQMVFPAGYVDPDRQIFLYPLSEWRQVADPGPVVRFPRDDV
ncbi:hypothetical protein F5Y17DRAFT_454574 [Xylariaceae sp. FL0594]|nr:hypothetical protein F5Y17DRAFT_454574 [Xylariaceae sp. FL0594]